MTGHGSLNNRLHQLGLAASELCACGASEDAAHALKNCDLYQDFREILLQRIGKETIESVGWTLVTEERELYDAMQDFAENVFGRRSTAEHPA